MSQKRLVILNGSPRKSGTSYSFARTIKQLAEDTGHTAEIVHIIEYFDGKKSFDSMKSTLAQHDIISVVAPLYVDTLPYPVIWFFEKLSLEMRKELRGKSFFAVGQNGFPDITLMEPLQGSCKCFAEATEMRWLGGLSYCGGAIINGELLENLGSKGRKITSGFKLALEDIFKDRQISSGAQDLLTLKIPKILYRPLAAFLNHKARITARKYGIADLERKVYLE
jgi:hypothetical protein